MCVWHNTSRIFIKKTNENEKYPNAVLILYKSKNLVFLKTTKNLSSHSRHTGSVVYTSPTKAQQPSKLSTTTRSERRLLFFYKNFKLRVCEYVSMM